MFSTKTFVVTFIASAVLIGVVTHILFGLTQDQQRQIDQLYHAMPHALTWDRDGDLDIVASCDKLAPGDYILCFADLKRGHAIVEQAPLGGPDNVSMNPSIAKGKRHYVHILYVPSSILKDWELREIRETPTLLRKGGVTSSIGY